MKKLRKQRTFKKIKHNNNTVLEKGPIGINFDNYFPSHLG